MQIAVGRKAYYAFSPRGQSLHDNVQATFRPPTWDGWNGEWVAIIFSIPHMNKDERYRVRKQLQHHQLAMQSPGFWTRPLHSNAQLDHYSTLQSNPHCQIIRYHHHPTITAEEVCTLFLLDVIQSGYQECMDMIYNLSHPLPDDPVECFRQKMLIGNQVVKQMARDPLLPDVYLPSDWLGHLVRNAFFQLNQTLTQASRPFWEPVIHSPNR